MYQAENFVIVLLICLFKKLYNCFFVNVWETWENNLFQSHWLVNWLSNKDEGEKRAGEEAREREAQQHTAVWSLAVARHILKIYAKSFVLLWLGQFLDSFFCTLPLIDQVVFVSACTIEH